MSKEAKLTLKIELLDKLSDKLGKVEQRITKFQDKAQNKLNKLADRFTPVRKFSEKKSLETSCL